MRKFYTLLVALVTAFAADAIDWCLAGDMTNNWEDLEAYKFTYESDGLYHLTLAKIEANKQFKLKEWGNWATNRSFNDLKNTLKVTGFDNFGVSNIKGKDGNNIYLDVTVENVELVFDGNYNLTFKNAASYNNEVKTSSFSWKADVEDGKYVAYFTNPNSWEQVGVWAWNSAGGKCYTGWPGITIEKVGRYYKWTYEGDVAPDKIIFNDGKQNTSTKTGDLDLINGRVYDFYGAGQPLMIETPLTARFYNIAGWEKVYISVYTGTMPIIKEKELTKSNDGFTYNIKLYVPEIPEATDFSDFSVVYTDGEGNECKANWVGDGMTDLNGELPAPKLDETTWPSGSVRPTAGQKIVWTAEIGTINIETLSSDAQSVKAQSASVPSNWELSTDGKTATYTYPEGGDNNIYKLTAVLEGAQSDFFILDLSNDGGVSGVTDVDADSNAEAVYFNLQGVRVAGELTPGMYICRQGDKVSKVVVR